MALGHEVVSTILRDKRFITMDPVENGVNSAIAGRNRLLQVFMKPILRVFMNRHKFLSMAKRWLVMNDPPTHYRLRKISETAFTPKAIRSQRPLIEKVTNDLLDQLEDKDEVDLIAEFALPLPIAMIAAIIGIPNEGSVKFNQWSGDLLRGFDQSVDSYDTVKQAMQSQDEVKEYLTAIIREREANPQDDIISIMLEARDNDDEEMYMTDDEIIANIILLLIAGHETTVNLIGNTMYSLLTHPDQYDELKQNPELLSNTIEESLRFDTPIVTIPRRASEDVELAGKQIKKGDHLMMMFYTANLDENIFEDPLTFDIHRENSKQHLSFGQGIHYCLGAPLARAEAEIAFGEIMKRFPDMSLVNPKPPRRSDMSFNAFNGFTELWVKLNK